MKKEFLSCFAKIACDCKLEIAARFGNSEGMRENGVMVKASARMNERFRVSLRDREALSCFCTFEWRH
jgi:hypothetical protein